MLSKQLFGFILLLIVVSLFVLADKGLATNGGGPRKLSETEAPELKAPPHSEAVEAGLQKKKKASNATQSPDTGTQRMANASNLSELDLKIIFGQLISILKDKNTTDWSKYILYFAIISCTIIVISLISTMFFYSISSIRAEARASREERKETEEVIKNLRNEIKTQVTETITRSLDIQLIKWNKIADDQIKELIEAIDKDFSLPLEERYLSMEFVYLDIWEKVTAAMGEAWGKDMGRFYSLWNMLFVAQLNLRLMLSGNEKDVFNGMCEMRAIAREGLVQADLLWDFICLLRKQKRLNLKNLAQARELGGELEKTFMDRDDA